MSACYDHAYTVFVLMSACYDRAYSLFALTSACYDHAYTVFALMIVPPGFSKKIFGVYFANVGKITF